MSPARTMYAGAVALALFAAVAGCAPADSGTTSASAAASASADCSASTLKTRTAGTFTVGTDKPAYPPYFIDDKPSNGKGFESAVAYAVAGKLGYSKAQVKWVVAGFNSVIQPGDKPFDVDINQFTITDERRQAVDFSSSYYDSAQSVITVKGSKAASAKSLADLRGLKLGAAVGSTSYTAITDVIKPSGQPKVYDDNDKAKLALKNGQVDAIVVDLLTGLYLTDVELKGGVMIGKLPLDQGRPEQLGMVLAKGSPLTGCVSAAVDALRQDGTLAGLEKQWLKEATGTDELR